jgi:hypothetical protein
MFLNLSDHAGHNFNLLVPPTISSQGHNKILNYLNLKSPTPYFSLNPWEMVDKKAKKIGSLNVVVEFWYNLSLKTLKIHTGTLNKEFLVSENPEKINKLIGDLFELIKIRNNEVVLEEFEEICIGQIVKSINNQLVFIRLLREKSRGLVEFHSSYFEGWDFRIQIFKFNGEKIETVLSSDEVCSKFSTNFNKFEEKLNEVFSRIDLHADKIFFSRYSSKVFKIVKVFSASKRILNTYNLSFYQIIERPELVLATAELLISFRDFYCLGLEVDENSETSDFFSSCCRDLTIRKGRLCLIKKDLDCFNYSACYIQKIVRGRRTREWFRLLKRSQFKPKIVFRSAKKIGNLAFAVMITEISEQIFIICSGDLTGKIEFSGKLVNSNYKLINDSLYIKEGKLEINTNLLTVFNKNSQFSVPMHIRKYKKVLEKWKMVHNDYCRISIYEQHENIAVLIDMKSKIYSKKEILDIYHELSYECIFDEVTLKNSEIYLDPISRPEPIFILSKKFNSPDSFISAIAKDHIGKDYLRQRVLMFDVSFNTIHHRVAIDLEEAVEKTGISKEFLVAISNYLIKTAIKATQDSISLNLDIPQFDINKKVNSIQKVFRGFKVRKNIGKIMVSDENYLIAVKKQKISGSEMMLFAYIQFSKIRIEAIDKEYRLVLYLDQNLVSGYGEERKKIIEDVIFANLFIDTSNRMKRLCIDTFVLQKPQRRARKITFKAEKKNTLKVSFASNTKDSYN